MCTIDPRHSRMVQGKVEAELMGSLSRCHRLITCIGMSIADRE